MTQVNSRRELINRQLRHSKLRNITAQIMEHNVTIEELTNYIANDYQPLSEQLQQKRRQVDVKVRQSEAGKNSDKKRRERLEAWRSDQRRRKELVENIDVDVSLPSSETSKQEGSVQQVGSFLEGL